MIPSPTEVTHFIEIYQTRHVSRAALRLGITQPTLTQSLQRLEAKLGSKLFHRTKQGVVPTASAAVFYRRAQSLRDCWQDIAGGVQAATNELRGEFVVGCHASVGAYALPPLLERIGAEAPGLRLKVMHESSRRVTEAVVALGCDVGFVVNPARHPDLVLKKIGGDRVTFWARKGRVPRRIFADRSREQIEQLLGRAFVKHFADWEVVSTTSLELIRTLAQSGLGVGVLPERVVRAEANDLALFDPKLPSKTDEIYLAYRREVLSSRAGRELVRLAGGVLA